MRNIDQQLLEIRQRSENIKREHRHRWIFGETGAACACLALIIAAAALIPKSGTALSGVTENHYGSLVLTGPFIGYAVIGVLAFALGICFTLLCYHMRYRGR